MKRYASWICGIIIDSSHAVMFDSFDSKDSFESFDSFDSFIIVKYRSAIPLLEPLLTFENVSSPFK